MNDEAKARRIARTLRRIKFVDRLFDSRRDSRRVTNTTDDVMSLLLPIIGGDIRIKLVRIPRATCEQARANGYFVSERTESAAHQFLKACAVRWMRDSGAEDARAEARLGPKRADAYSDNLNWIVECGNTPITKVLSALNPCDPARFTLIPYQMGADCWREGPCRSLLGAEFARPAIAATFHPRSIPVGNGYLGTQRDNVLDMVAKGRGGLSCDEVGR